MRKLSELEKLLLIQAFDGRPLNTRIDAGKALYVVTIKHENDRHWVQMLLGPEERRLLETDFDQFRKTIAEPIMHNLDGVAYPERWARLMPSIKRAAELMANGGL